MRKVTREMMRKACIILLGIVIFMAGVDTGEVWKLYQDGYFASPEKRFAIAKERFAKEYILYLKTGDKPKAN